jgi:hypothetical protein
MARPNIRSFSLMPLSAENPEGVEAEVVFVHDSADAAFDRARLAANRTRLGGAPRHLTISCAEGLWDGVVALGVAMGTKGCGYLDRVYRALHAFAQNHPSASLCVWIDEAQTLNADHREGIFRLLKYVGEELQLNLRICLVLRQKTVKVYSPEQRRYVPDRAFPNEGPRLRQIARAWNANNNGLMEADWERSEEREERSVSARIA